jgi:hypothetical protein
MDVGQLAPPYLSHVHCLTPSKHLPPPLPPGGGALPEARQGLHAGGADCCAGPSGGAPGGGAGAGQLERGPAAGAQVGGAGRGGGGGGGGRYRWGRALPWGGGGVGSCTPHQALGSHCTPRDQLPRPRALTAPAAVCRAEVERKRQADALSTMGAAALESLARKVNSFNSSAEGGWWAVGPFVGGGGGARAGCAGGLVGGRVGGCVSAAATTSSSAPLAQLPAPLLACRQPLCRAAAPAARSEPRREGGRRLGPRRRAWAGRRARAGAARRWGERPAARRRLPGGAESAAPAAAGRGGGGVGAGGAGGAHAAAGGRARRAGARRCWQQRRQQQRQPPQRHRRGGAAQAPGGVQGEHREERDVPQGGGVPRGGRGSGLPAPISPLPCPPAQPGHGCSFPAPSPRLPWWVQVMGGYQESMEKLEIQKKLLLSQVGAGGNRGERGVGLGVAARVRNGGTAGLWWSGGMGGGGSASAAHCSLM